MRRGRGGQGAMSHQTFSRNLMLRRKIFGLLLLEKMKVSNFVGKSLNLTTSTGATAPLGICGTYS